MRSTAYLVTSSLASTQKQPKSMGLRAKEHNNTGIKYNQNGSITISVSKNPMINQPAIKHLRQTMKSKTCSHPQIQSSKSQQGRGSLVLPLHQHGPKQALSSTTGATAHVTRSNLGYQFHTAISPEQHVAGSIQCGS